MHAVVGDHVHIKSPTVGQHELEGEIVEVQGQQGEPPYRVRFDDGHESLMFPGADCQIEHRS
ncbi:DUF1918 domain-containing protein [Hoyosella rhizosphaerae]|uniref:DUF1918 domain-containing protein n=1 Tax=Hoyosella rhizosphaerae TaxID=1755582 RepID=A0A916XDT4_9ACTN|nr:DUF1918 domain-containing protein [Hoyosella rhizosphaerae]MBN4927596.1 DUF1918 domain-containing protein [Hoyosella rhizosphaerae]GGC63220.1 hypothetical protein GCM10011410_14560 [Hoyosella rhizosphaerae]